MQIQVITESNDIPERTHIALDTCVFIDAFHNPDKFKDFFVFLKERNVVLTTTYLNYLEFSRGFDTIKGFKNAEDFLYSIVDFIYPIKDIEDSMMEKIKYAYRREGGIKEIQLADLFLGALALNYGDKLQILTKNHKDFIKDLFEVTCYLPYDSKGNHVQIYCLYKFSNNKYAQRMLDLERTK